MDNSNNLYLKYNFRINAESDSVSLITSECFDRYHVYNDDSPINNFFESAKELNRFESPESLRQIDRNMVILLYVALVESYFREILRSIINVDKYALKTCESSELKFHSARTLAKEMLPIAILEDYSFAGSKSIEDAFRKILGIKGNFPREIKDPLNDFEKVCQFRHCIIHKFGYLGPDNVIKLGSSEHEELMNKPLLLNFEQLQEVINACNNIVKDVNNYLFKWFVTATIKYEYQDWTQDYDEDKEIFSKYFDIFYSKEHREDKEVFMKEAYDEFLKVFTDQ